MLRRGAAMTRHPGFMVYHASIAGRFLPVRCAGGRIELRRFASQLRDSAGSMTSSMPKMVAMLSALPRS